MNISAYSIKNPLVAVLLFSLLTLMGLGAFYKLKIQQFPDITLPAVVVTVTLPGAAPNQLENDIAKPIENRIANLEGIKHLNTTLQTGAATVVAEFELSKDIQEALDEVRSATGEARGDLPAAAGDPIISKVSTAGFPVATYTVTSNNLNLADLSWYVDDTLTKSLSNVEGVGKIARIGGTGREILVEIDPSALSAFKMPISNVSDQIYANQQEATGGQAEIAQQNQTIRVLGTADSLQALGDMQIISPDGTPFALSSIARISDTAQKPSSIATLNGNSVVAFHVTRTRGASEVEVVRAIDKQIATINQTGVAKISKVFDRAEPIYQDYKASMQMLIEGCILAVIVVWLFLRNWRATLVAAAALPLSIIPTFLVMQWFGFSLNMISLLALSLVIGVLVDDAIVEIENIVRHLQMGKTPYEAAMEAADEIGLAVIATTFTLVAVFLPTAFMSGVVGQFFQQFGWTAAIAVVMSLVVARMITPMMAAYIMKPHKAHHASTGKSMQGYLRFVNWTLNHRAITLLATVLLFIGSLALVKFLPVAFIPADDGNQSRVEIELTPDATLDDTQRITMSAIRAVSGVAGVKDVLSQVGSAGGGGFGDTGSSGSNVANLDILLEPRGTRDDKTQIERNIANALKDVPSARFKVGLSTGGESGYSFSLTSSNASLLDDYSEQVMREIRKLPMASDVISSKSLPNPEILVTPNRVKMADFGTNTLAVADTLRIATVGNYARQTPKLNLDTRQLPITVRLPDEAKSDLDALKNLYVGQKGATIADVADLHFGGGIGSVTRLDRERAVKISVQSQAELGELVQAVKALPILQNRPQGIGIIEQGQAENMNELFGGFLMAMGVGIFCIFAVLILLFNKLLQPFTILMALPLSIGGAFVGLLITGSSLSMPSMIGFVMLMGIATKNSILLVDYAIIAQREGMARTQAIIDACKKRARPIIMTTIAMGAGMLPLVFGWGGADPTFRQPMAAAVLGGLITSTALSLIVIPVVYTLMDDISRLFSKKHS